MSTKLNRSSVKLLKLASTVKDNSDSARFLRTEVVGFLIDLYQIHDISTLVGVQPVCVYSIPHWSSALAWSWYCTFHASDWDLIQEFYAVNHLVDMFKLMTIAFHKRTDMYKGYLQENGSLH